MRKNHPNILDAKQIPDPACGQLKCDHDREEPVGNQAGKCPVALGLRVFFAPADKHASTCWQRNENYDQHRSHDEFPPSLCHIPASSFVISMTDEKGAM